MEATYAAINSGDPIPWMAWHDSCLEQDFSYHVPIGELRTVEGCEWWTDHLSGKNWYHRSDWRVVMAAAGVDVSGVEWPANPPGDGGVITMSEALDQVLERIRPS